MPTPKDKVSKCCEKCSGEVRDEQAWLNDYGCQNDSCSCHTPAEPKEEKKPVGGGIWACVKCGGDRMYTYENGDVVLTKKAPYFPCSCRVPHPPAKCNKKLNQTNAYDPNCGHCILIKEKDTPQPPAEKENWEERLRELVRSAWRRREEDFYDNDGDWRGELGVEEKFVSFIREVIQAAENEAVDLCKRHYNTKALIARTQVLEECIKEIEGIRESRTMTKRQVIAILREKQKPK